MISEGSTSWIGRANRSLKKRGFLGTVKFAGAIVKDVARRRIFWPYLHFTDKAFDWRFNVDTAGEVFVPELQSDPRFKNSNQYQPTSRSLFLHMVRQIDVDYGKFVFIDFGWGKGKALLLAAGLPFKAVIGVELSANLIEGAGANLRKYRGRRRCNTFDLACVDAGEYPIPREPSIYYFYNPFHADVMRKVLENIRRSLGEAPRDAYVVYHDPDFKSLLDESGFMVPIRQESWYSIYRASGR